MRGELLIEGGRFVREAFEAGADIGSCFFTEAAAEHWQSLLQELEGHGAELLRVTGKVMDTIGDTVTPQGLVAVARAPHSIREDVFEGARLVLVADRIADPGNLGTMLRTAAAVGAAVILTTGCVDITSPKVVRASAGAMYSTPLWMDADHLEVTQAALARGYRIVVCDAAGTLPYHATDLTGSVAVVVGNEAHGPAPAWGSAKNPVLVHIPMPGRAESLNASVAAAIVMYESLRQRGGGPC